MLFIAPPPPIAFLRGEVSVILSIVCTLLRISAQKTASLAGKKF